MSDSPRRYMFAGHVIGAQARFHRLDDTPVNEVVPAVGATALSGTGGRSENNCDRPFRYTVNHPRPRCLLAVERAHGWVEGRDPEGRIETELSVKAEGLAVLEKLHIENVSLHLLAVRKDLDSEATVSTRGSKIEGLRMGNVTAWVTLDDEPLTYTGSQQQLAAFYGSRDQKYRDQHGARFFTTPDKSALAEDCGHHRFNIVRCIELSGPEVEKQSIEVNGNRIYWHGFGRIILGEVHVKGQERRVSLVRLQMGSDGGGSGTSGSGGSNGTPSGG